MVFLMLTFTEGNLLTANADALVNTVNEVGVMGKGIALMFREAFPENNREYEKACKRGQVRVGHMLVVENRTQWGPKWIINFPTKKHWRQPSKVEWIRDGLKDLLVTIVKLDIKSIAIPPLGCGNGGLEWEEVKRLIVETLGTLKSVEVQVFAPTAKYQNLPKEIGVGKLTPARALIAEMVRRYEILGFECSLLEVQKLAWFLQRGLVSTRIDDPLRLTFAAGKFGPYADSLRHVLNGLDGSYLHSQKRIADASRHDVLTFEHSKDQDMDDYLSQPSMKKYGDAIEWTQKMIEGFESPYGMELLATVDWLLTVQSVDPNLDGLRTAIRNWSYSADAASRKASLFDDRVLGIALKRILDSKSFESSQRTLPL
jgi:O-acetyl-ADP-ribose deacetylase (regulator of RNase III)